MSNPSKNVMKRVPPEVWWEIFEQVFSIEGLFTTTYQGNDWAGESAKLEVTDFESFQRADEQRRVLRSVCKLWKHLSDTVGRRLVPILLNNTEQCSSVTMDTLVNTWRVYIRSRVELPQSLVGMTVQWRVLRVFQGSSNEVEKVFHPHVRRLELLGSRSRMPHAPDNLINTLKSYENITWFRFTTTSPGSFGHCLEDDGGERFTLPNLQVLFYRGTGAFHLPFYRLILPSLLHLTVSSSISIDLFPLQSLILAYGRTLRSLCISVSSRSNYTARSNLFGIEEGEDGYFPRWDLVPRLQELTIEGSGALKFHPLPPTHPLRVFGAQIWSIRKVSSWINSANNLKVLKMLHTAREPDGTLVRTDTDDILLILDSEELEELEEKAKSKGIQLVHGKDRRK
ncbi:hypothetical protein FRC17_003332 [Serendipita sp. 399]|nr:hypothetical protein FRC17_003332 [Serendipita sp. 399]